MKRVLVVDGQGGGVGKALVEQIKQYQASCTLIAVGTNALATSAMLRAGADAGATGENAVCFNSRDADVIVGPIGIVLANAMYGEMTPAAAQAVAESRAHKVLIPVQRCCVTIAGVAEKPMMLYIEEAAREVCRLLEE